VKREIGRGHPRGRKKEKGQSSKSILRKKTMRALSRIGSGINGESQEYGKNRAPDRKVKARKIKKLKSE